MSDNNEDGRKLRNARLDKGYSQRELADRMKVHFSLISYVENGFRRLSYSSKYRINKILGKVFELQDVPPLVKCRVEKGYSQQELAELLGISECVLCGIEHCRMKIPNRLIPKLNEILGLDLKLRPELSGVALRNARIAKGHSQEAVAIAMKVSQNTISAWELGVHKIPLDDAQQLIALLNIPQE